VPARSLAATLGDDAPELWIKMDSETGFGLGGNKVRKLEFELTADRLEGVTHLITAGGPQSNHCRVTAAAAAHLGLRCVLVLNGPEPEVPAGNAKLHRLFGAEIVTVQDRDGRTAAMDDVAERINHDGGRALVVPIGASTGLGALGYALATVELVDQLDALPERERTWIFTSASSCGTLGGLLLGVSLLGREDIRLVGVSADATAFEIRTESERLAREGAALRGGKALRAHRRRRARSGLHVEGGGRHAQMDPHGQRSPGASGGVPPYRRAPRALRLTPARCAARLAAPGSRTLDSHHRRRAGPKDFGAPPPLPSGHAPARLR
jgi:1-aminocyclopropane-1-carboxylate deaminase/D-cysteine desulfhydrase-like pyridoxal-dependent ACC family enzyme